MKNTLYIMVVVTSYCLLYANISLARTINVPSEFSTIRSAVSEAEEGDTVLVDAGVYIENLNVRKTIEIISVAGPDSTIIDGSGNGTVVIFVDAKFNGSMAPKIAGFTIQNGSSSEGRGGGITMYNSDTVVENNRIVNNSAAVDGGGILLNTGSTGTIRNNYISANFATRFGGGINVVGGSNPLIYNNDIVDNNVSGPTYGTGLGKWGASGAGIYVDGDSSPQLIGNTIDNNSADFSGGGVSLRLGSASLVEDNIIRNNTSTTGSGIHIETEGGNPVIRNNEIYNNDAFTTVAFPNSGFGGGISVYNSSRPLISENSIYDNFATKGGGGIVNSENAESTILNNKIYNNETTSDEGEYSGGAMYVADSTVVFKNNLVRGNTARLGGGISLLDNAEATITNNTIIENSAPFDATRKSGGGIFVKGSVSTVSITSNIITQNQDYQIVEWTEKASINSNLINDDDLGIYFNDETLAINDIGVLNSSAGVDASSNISGAEEFVNQAGGDYDILATSGAIDQGASTGSPGYDYDYNLRPFGVGVDMGAYEYTTSTEIFSPIYRFWSDAYQKHFYTIEDSEKNYIFNNYLVNTWKYERIAFRAHKLTYCSADQVYRFWSDTKQGHFYTISESEKNYVIDNYDDSVWSYEGPRFCAEENITGNTNAVYRFWSDTKQTHFYTASEAEKNYVVATYPEEVWKYESIAYYVYPVN